MNIKYLILPWNANKKPFLLPSSYCTTNFLFVYLFIYFIFISPYAVITCKLFIHWIIRYQIKFKVTFLLYFIFTSQDYQIITKKGRQYFILKYFVVVSMKFLSTTTS